MQKILSRVIFIGFSVQIILGIFWMVDAFADLSLGEGIVCVGLAVLFGIAVFFAKRWVFGKDTVFKDGFVMLSTVTFPFVMQCFRNPDYRLIIAIALLLATGFMIHLMCKTNGVKKVVIMLSFWVLSASLVIGTEAMCQGWTPFSVKLTERIAWTTLYKSFNRMPDESWYAIDYFKMGESTHEVLGVRTILAPSLTEELGEEKAAELLSELRALSWEYEKKQIIKEIAWDTVGYTLSPVVLQLQLEGRAYESYSGMNYRELLQNNPGLGNLYAEYSCWWFVVALISGMLIWIENWIKKTIRISGREFLAVVVTEVGMIIWYTMDGAGRMDYKNTLFVLCSWLLLVSVAAMRSFTAEQTMEQAGGSRNEKE